MSAVAVAEPVAPPTRTVSVNICAYTEDRWDLLCRAVESVHRQTIDGEHPDVAPEIVVVIDHNDALLLPECPGVARPVRGAESSRARTVGRSQHRDRVVARRHHRVPRRRRLRATELVTRAGRPVRLGRHRSHRRSRRAGLGAGCTVVVPRRVLLGVVGARYRGHPTEPTDIRNPIGASMAVRRRVFDTVGTFTDGIGRLGSTPLGCEETELSIRAAGAGFRCRATPGATVSHWVSPDRHSFAYFVQRCRAEGVSKASVSRLTSTSTALATERGYVARTIPLGIVRAMRRAIVGPRRGALSEAAALVVGTLVTAATYATARVRLRSLG